MNRYEAKEYVERAQRLLRMAAGDEPRFDEDLVFLREAGIEFDTWYEEVKVPVYDDDEQPTGEMRVEHRFARYILPEASRVLLKMRCADLEEEAAELLFNPEAQALFRIITSDPSGPSDDPKTPNFNRLEPVVEIEVVDKPKILEWPDGSLEKVMLKAYVANSAVAHVAGLRMTRDWTASSPEGVLKADKRQYGAAMALTARLLEAHAAGQV